jgi:hypothetical protein
VALVVSPRARDSHQVGGEFLQDHFEWFMHQFPSDMPQDRMWHLGLDTIGSHSIGQGCPI